MTLSLNFAVQCCTKPKKEPAKASKITLQSLLIWIKGLGTRIKE